jgi:lipoprotein NlpI
LLALGVGPAVAAAYDDYADGLSALFLGDADRAVASFTTALKAGDLNANLVPVAYFNRARAYLDKGSCAAAAADLTSAIKLRPDYLDAYERRVAANRCVGDLASADSDCVKLITLKPDTSNYFTCGQVLWQEGNYSGAADDLAKSLALHPAEAHAPYVVLWLAIARLRGGAFDAEAMARDISSVDVDGWPAPIFDLYLGKTQPEDVRHAAETGDVSAVNGRRCQTNFYTAEWWLARHNSDAAKPLLVDARANCPHEFMEYFAASAELMRLEAPFKGAG